MSRMANDVADLPPHMRAVLFRHLAREADLLAHNSESPEEKEPHCRLAEQLRALAAQSDAESDSCEIDASSLTQFALARP